MLHGAETEGCPELAYACPWLYSSESTYKKNDDSPPLICVTRLPITIYQMVMGSARGCGADIRVGVFGKTHFFSFFVHAYHEGSGFKNPSLVPWLVMGGTWDLDPDDFLLQVFFLDFFLMEIGPCGPVPSPPLDCTSFPPLVTAVLITPKGAESPCSRRIGVIGALVLILLSDPRQSRTNFTLPSRPGTALRY